MGERRIRGVVRDRNGLTLAVCLQEPGGPLVVLRDVIADIEQGRNSYIVDAGGRPTRVSVVHDPDGVYLRTSPRQ
jgi:hypothetical protein